MNTCLDNLRKLAELILTHPWNSPSAWVALAMAIIALFFGAGTIARVIFGKETGLVRAFIVALLVLATGLIGTAAAWTWLTPSLPLAAGLGIAASLAAVWPASKVLRVAYGQAFGILLFTLTITAGIAYGSGRVCTLILDGARKMPANQRTTE